MACVLKLGKIVARRGHAPHRLVREEEELRRPVLRVAVLVLAEDHRGEALPRKHLRHLSALVLDLDRKEVRRVKIVLLVVLAAGVAAAADAERVHILADLRCEGGCKRR